MSGREAASPVRGRTADDRTTPEAPAATERAPAVRVRDLWVARGGRDVLRGVDLDVATGEVLCVIGPSGSGKSTLLRSLNALVPSRAGTIEVCGELIGHRRDGDRLRPLSAGVVARQRARLGMVSQQFDLFSHLTVLDNLVEAPTGVLGRPAPQARSRASELLAQVGLAGREHAYPAQLSGGQQQRVAIARALAMDPAVMLFDEPTSALDPELTAEVAQVLAALARAGTTMITVTHDIGLVRAIADEIVFLDDGAVVESGPADQLLGSPRTVRLQEFLRLSSA